MARMTRPPRSPYRYLLGDASDEARRLRAQARLWDPVSHELFDRIRIGRGWNVLEIGPGQGSLHLELRRRVRGPVDAVERSGAFAARLAAACRRDGHGRGRTWTCDLIDADLPRGHYDLIFARWVFLFLPDAAAHVRLLARALRPGGVLAVQDYHRDSLTLVPPPPEWPSFLAADHAFFASQGGSASIASELPTHFRAAGLRLAPTRATIMQGHPKDAVWTWMTTYFLSVMDRLAEFPPFDRVQADRLRETWLAAAKDPASLLIAPTVLDVVGRKRR
jgi:SAM-dependent methyltransferase